MQRVIVFAFNAFPGFAVAADTMLFVDGLTWRRFGAARWSHDWPNEREKHQPRKGLAIEHHLGVRAPGIPISRLNRGRGQKALYSGSF